MIVLENITVTIDSKPILKNINCKIEQHDFIMLLGANGAGKSTFFDVLTGKRKPTTGRILFNNQDITHQTEQQRARYIGRLFQNPRLNGVSSMTVEQNLAIATYKDKKATLQNGMSSLDLEYIKEQFGSLNVTDPLFLKTYMKDLSGGQRQTLAFVMATLIIPQLLLLDEPTAALDPVAATNLLKFVTHYIKTHHLTTLLITHDPQLALTIGNKIWILQDGQLIKQFEGAEKLQISADQLVGQIEYTQLN